MMFTILVAHKNYYDSWLFHTAVCLGTPQSTHEGFCLGTPQSTDEGFCLGTPQSTDEGFCLGTLQTTDEGLSSKCMIKLQVQKHGPLQVEALI